MKKPVLIVFGGISAEHEVSVITGLQIVETIDRAHYEPYAIYITKKGEFLYLRGLKDRHGFFSTPRKQVMIGKDKRGGFVTIEKTFGTEKIYPYAAYLALHGGKGESGPTQGLLEEIEVPFTSCGTESSAVTMNKTLTRMIARDAGIPVAPGMSVRAQEIQNGTNGAANIAKEIIKAIALPVIIKPVHLGSSIGITIARTEVELQKHLLEAAFVDNEILVEKYLTLAAEYNCAVRSINNSVEASEVERPLTKDEILSFADKYQRGGKKVGAGAGMASLERELPAHINVALRQSIQDMAKKIFIACNAKGMMRIDFMLTTDTMLYLTEVNPIPGSMAFYLWEASGIPFKQQITDLIEQAVRDEEKARSTHLDYETDIIKKFTES